MFGLKDVSLFVSICRPPCWEFEEKTKEWTDKVAFKVSAVVIKRIGQSPASNLWPPATPKLMQHNNFLQLRRNVFQTLHIPLLYRIVDELDMETTTDNPLRARLEYRVKTIKDAEKIV